VVAADFCGPAAPTLAIGADPQGSDGREIEGVEVGVGHSLAKS
jgi:hypothetical protein